MRTLAESRLLRFVAFGALYLAQGLPWGFIAVGYPVLLTDAGLDKEAVGWAQALAYIPWSFKILWGPVIDRVPSLRFGRRRPYIVVAQGFIGVSLLALLFVDPAKQLGLVGAILFVNNAFASLQDVAVDALAVDLLPADERGRANSIMFACKSGGVALGGGGGIVLAKFLGWPALFVILAVSMWLIMLIPLFARERPDNVAAPESRFNWTALKSSFSFATPYLGIAVALLTPMGYALVSGPFTPMLRGDLKMTEEQIGTLSGIIEPLAGVVGSLIGGVVVDRLGPRRSMGLFMVGIGIVLASFASLPGLRPSFGFLAAYLIALNLCIYAYTASSLAFFMTLSNPAIGATQFAVYMASTNFCYAFTSPAGGWLADTYGPSVLWSVAAVVQLVTIAVLLTCDPRRAEERFRLAPAA
jgi:MFS transporter, PAT family, beta-lactamase induction signal transducer AmpG